MKRIRKIIESMHNSPQDIKFSELSLVCEHFFGKPRNNGTSHHVYKMPWAGDPRINIQKGKGGKAKIYQVKQVLIALSKLEEVKEND